MSNKRLMSLAIIGAMGLSMPMLTAHAGGMFDWMSPNKWFNSRDHDRDYRGWGYPGYGYPGYGYPTYGYGYPAYGYPAWGGYGYTYPNYAYPTQQQQNNNTPAAPPVPQ
jgi:uncharacterized membrane protein